MNTTTIETNCRLTPDIVLIPSASRSIEFPPPIIGPAAERGEVALAVAESWGAGSPFDGRASRPQAPPLAIISPDRERQVSAPAPRLPAEDLATESDWMEAQTRANLCAEFLRLTEQEHHTTTGACRALGVSPSMFCGPNSSLSKYLRGGVAALLPAGRGAAAAVNVGELTKALEALGWFIPAAKFFFLQTNLSDGRGSVPEAIRRTISLPCLPVGWREDTRRRLLKKLALAEPPACPHELREAILAREKAGQPLVPARIARQITVARAVVRQHRHPTNAALDYLNASGSLFFITDRNTGERRPPLVGEVIEADDATINFPVCVPWTLGGDPCSDKWGVKVGRFQWLVCVDAASRYVTAWTYVMRPRSSYRAEDALALMRGHCVQHGIPGQWRFERGVWKSKLVQHAVKGLASELQTVWSPHQKPYIEGLFNSLWTKLSVQFPDSDVGRYQGETEGANDLLVACQRGSRDPRRHFPMLSTALAAFDETVQEKSGSSVGSAVGRWVPAELWAQRSAATGDQSRSGEVVGRAYPVRRMAAETEWLFSPYVREWTVRGMIVGGRIPLFDDLSVPFDFAADFLAPLDGARVRCHFNPAEPRCQAMVVLLEHRGNHRAGEVLGLAMQINEVAGYARMVLGWGDDPTQSGRLARQRAASALRREVRGVMPGGQGYRHSEERDGISQVATIQKDSAAIQWPTLDPERKQEADDFVRSRSHEFYRT